MTRRVIRRPSVQPDLLEIADSIARDSLDVALRFLTAAEDCFIQLAMSPELGVTGEFTAPALDGVRRWRISDFENYLVFYRPVADGVEIIRVLHGARDIVSLFADS